MLSKNKVKYIKSLQLKKFRKEENVFVVEGAKSVAELMGADFEISFVAATESFLVEHESRIPKSVREVVVASEKELSDAGTFQTNDSALAIAKMKPNMAPVIQADEYALVLDDIRDPGNLGTILRTADWYGIRNVIASHETADLYNAKTLSASMGSFLRVNVFYTLLAEFLTGLTPVYGTFLKGDDVHQIHFGKGGYVVIGNESNGISPEVERLVQKRINIRRYGRAESLNAGIATAIVLDNLRRSQK